jgi:hypothetical protein
LCVTVEVVCGVYRVRPCRQAGSTEVCLCTHGSSIQERSCSAKRGFPGRTVGKRMALPDAHLHIVSGAYPELWVRLSRGKDLE